MIAPPSSSGKKFAASPDRLIQAMPGRTPAFCVRRFHSNRFWSVRERMVIVPTAPRLTASSAFDRLDE